MTATERSVDDLTLTINQEIHVQAPLDTTFAALLEQLGPGNETPDGKSMNMKIEAWPGGRAVERYLGPGMRAISESNFLIWASSAAISLLSARALSEMGSIFLGMAAYLRLKMASTTASAPRATGQVKATPSLHSCPKLISASAVALAAVFCSWAD